MKNLICAVALACSASVRAENLLVNPCFDGAVKDGKAEGWQMDGKKCVAGYGYGRNSSNGLKYAGDGGPYSWVVQSVPVEVGKPYRLEGWVKTENIRSAKGVRLHLSFFTAENRWCESTDSDSVSGTTDDWTLLTVEATPQKNAVRAEISVRLDDGETGVAYLDDFQFGKTAKPPIRFLVSDAYRDTASDGLVNFRLVTNLTDKEIVARGLRGRILLPAPDVKRRQKAVSAPAFKDGVCAFSVDLKEMPHGEFPVSFALEDANRIRVATKTLIFNRPREMPKRKVWIDRQGRAIVDGKPFFPLGMFMDGMSGEKAELYAAGPFNCVLPYEALTRAQLDWADAKGLKVVYCLKNHYRGYGFQPYAMPDEDDETAVVASHIAAVKDHPALLAWYTADEMGPGMIPRLRMRGRLFRQIDPGHPTVNCICRPDIARDYMETTDILSSDPYPIHAGMKPEGISLVAADTHRLRRAYFGMRPLWQVTQAFDTSYISKDKTKIRFPTKEEELNMNLQCVAAGANGIFMWAYHHVGQSALGRQDFDRCWKELCEVGSVMRPMLPVFLSDDISSCVRGRQHDLPVRAWRHEGKVWVLAVNASPVRKTAEIAVDGRKLAVDLPPLGYFFDKLEHGR